MQSNYLPLLLMHLIRGISALTQTLKIKMLIQYNCHRKHSSSLASTYVRVFQDYQGLWVKKRLLQILHLAIKPPLLLRSDRPGRCKAPLSINIKGAAPRHFKSHGFQIVPNSLLFRPFRQLEHRQPWLKIIYQFDLIVKAWRGYTKVRRWKLSSITMRTHYVQTVMQMNINFVKEF